jgi:acetylornithine deacetylase
MDNLDTLAAAAVKNLQGLIAIPSFSREENQTADFLASALEENGVGITRIGNNVIARNKFFDEQLPTLLLNSHHDTVKPNKGYTRDPFAPTIEDGKLYGLGSNDAGGCLVSLLAAFLHFYNQPGLKYNLVFAATAEEEISGTGGIEMILSELPQIDGAIVGEPTLLQLAVAERGLMVLDCLATGVAGHAARQEGVNALYKAVADINWISSYAFEKVSDFLGPVQTTVTVIETENKAHNVVPAQCKFVVDVRVNELYTFEDILTVFSKNLTSEIKPRSTRLRSTAVAMDHPLVTAGLQLGSKPYGSPTTSDKALMPFPALKMGPGDSARSHTADEFIFVSEIEQGVATYINLLKKIL